MLSVGKGRCSASPQMETSTQDRLADASSVAASSPIVVRSTPFRRATALARQGMSPRQVPTSSSVAWAGKSRNAPSSSSMTALIPPNSALAHATSESDRVTTCGSTSGASSNSTPLVRGGVRMCRIVLPLELGVAAAIIEERRAVLSARRIHFAEDYRMVTALVQTEAAALDDRQDVVENRVACRRPAEADSLEPVDIHDREAAGDLLLSRRQYVHDESRCVDQRLVHRSGLFDADENEWGIETQRREG